VKLIFPLNYFTNQITFHISQISKVAGQCLLLPSTSDTCLTVKSNQDMQISVTLTESVGAQYSTSHFIASQGSENLVFLQPRDTKKLDRSKNYSF